jgi:GNAT superfamily N-acetyltransferase
MDKHQIIFQATEKDLTTVYNICKRTIEKMYPNYYPKGAVDYFLAYHSKEKIKEDIEKGYVYIYKFNSKVYGTISFFDNHIYRFFVEPKNQHQGYGKQLIVFAEWMIFKKYDCAILDASFPSKNLYLKNGYKEIEYNKVETDNGDYLCFDVMKKEK